MSIILDKPNTTQKSGITLDTNQSGKPAFDVEKFVNKSKTNSSLFDSAITGFGKGALSSFKGFGQLGEKIGNTLLSPFGLKNNDIYSEEALQKNKESGGAMGKLLNSENLEGKNTAENIGKTAEQVAEFFIPGGATTKVATKASEAVNAATKAATSPYVGKTIGSLLGRATGTGAKAVVRGAEGAGVVAAQTGGDAKQTTTAGLFSAALPVAGALANEGKKILKPLAPRIINSLIKPLLKDLSYGKNPGRAISELGITASSLEELGQKVGEARQKIGQQLSAIYKKAENFIKPNGEKITIDLNPEIQKIDQAIKDAAKGGKENQAVVTRLQNMKDALLFEHNIDAEGNIIKTGTTPKDLSNLSPEEAFNFKKQVGDMTRFSGNPTDDKTVNSIFKQIYGGVKEKLNTSMKEVDPNIEKLNEQYADLTSGETAAKYRDKIEQRQNLITVSPLTSGLGSSLIYAVTSGGAAIPSILAGATVAGLQKALSTPRVKTAVAKWLAESTPAEKQKLFDAAPALRGLIIKTFSPENK